MRIFVFVAYLACSGHGFHFARRCVHNFRMGRHIRQSLTVLMKPYQPSDASLKRTSSAAAHAAADPLEWDSWSGSRMDEFMNEVWQRRPLLVRGAFPNLKKAPLLSPKALLQLSSEEDVSSRIVMRCRDMIDGPVDRKFIKKQKNGQWTILVNDMERLLPEFDDLLNHFKCIPTWRFGDVMVSLAPDGGGIGAHVDSYDVFLLQGSGAREWSIAAEFISIEEGEERMTPRGTDMRVLTDYAPTHKWIMQPGDMLYLPPRVPHCGVSKSDDCTTISVGFTMPYEAEVLMLFSEFVAEKNMQNGEVLAGRSSDAGGGSRISSDVLASTKDFILSSVQEVLNDDKKFSEWFGSFITRRQREPTSSQLPLAGSAEGTDQIDQLLSQLQMDPELRLIHPIGIKCAYVLLDGEEGESNDKGWIFADGKCFGFPREVIDDVPKLTERGASLSSDFVLNAKPALLDLLKSLISAGVFQLEEF